MKNNRTTTKRWSGSTSDIADISFTAMNSAFYQGAMWGAWITPVQAVSGQPQNERFAYKLA